MYRRGTGRRIYSSKRKTRNYRWKNRINNKLFQDYFKYQGPSQIYKRLNDTKKTERNKIQVNLFKSALTDLKNGNMSMNEKRIDRANELADIVEKILKFNNQIKEG